MSGGLSGEKSVCDSGPHPPPQSVSHMKQSLKSLKLASCTKLNAVGDSIASLITDPNLEDSALTELDISLTPNGGGFSNIVSSLVNLEQLKMYGCSYVADDDLLVKIGKTNLPKLKKIWIGFCRGLSKGAIEKFREMRPEVTVA